MAKIRSIVPPGQLRLDTELSHRLTPEAKASAAARWAEGMRFLREAEQRADAQLAEARIK